MLKLSQCIFEGQWWTPCLNMPSNHPHEVAIVDIWLSIGIDSKLFNQITDFQWWCQSFLALSNKYLHVFQKLLHLPCGGYLLQTYDFASSPLGGPGPVGPVPAAKVDWLMTSGIRVCTSLNSVWRLIYNIRNFYQKRMGCWHHLGENCFEDKGSTFQLCLGDGWWIRGLVWSEIACGSPLMIWSAIWMQ